MSKSTKNTSTKKPKSAEVVEPIESVEPATKSSESQAPVDIVEPTQPLESTEALTAVKPPQTPKAARPEKPERPERPIKKRAEKKDKESTPAHVMPPIIKKVKKHGHGHHGGSWKIAFADFVTAMMAFFLLMWLISSLNKAQKEGISEYFKQPLKVVFTGSRSTGASVVSKKGGGPDVKQQDGQISGNKKPESPAKNIVVDVNKNETKKLEELKSQIKISMDKDPSLSDLKKQLQMDITPEGLKIQLIDNKSKPMFDVGSDKLNTDMQPILAKIAKLLNSVSNSVAIEGHTDAQPYHNPDELEYTNWELSSQRANAARRALVKAGMDENKVATVSGYSSTRLQDKANPLNPENRRISIIVMKNHPEKPLPAQH